MAMMHDASRPESAAARLAAECSVPAEPFDPDGAWVHAYRDLTTFHLRPQGQLRIERQPTATGSTLTVSNSRICPSNHRYIAHAVLNCAGDAISATREWRVDTKVAESADGAARLNSALSKHAHVDGDTVLIHTGAHTAAHRFTGALTCKWCLLDAVQRGPLAAADVLPFTLVDEYDQLFPGQELRRRESVTLPLRDGPAALTVYQLTGRGTIPATFWVHPNGRLLFMISGMQALALDVADGGKEQ